MEQLNLTVEMRQGTGKGVNRKLRAIGKLPVWFMALGRI